MTTDSDKLAEHDPHFEATAAALDHITSHAASSEDPQSTLHTPSSDRQASHRWLERIFPSYSSLEAMESAFHMGSYVITDRKTGSQSKVFEPMSIYVRIGMHALYYGTAQEKFLRWERTIKLLEDQSIKMGEQYDDPASVKHIRPFIQSFGLEESLKELKEPDPEKYGTFNEFFSREIREDARPIAEPGNVSRIVGFTSFHVHRQIWLFRVVVTRADFPTIRYRHDCRTPSSPPRQTAV
jgi:phosphatidylserine decarboxylase